MDTNDLSRRRRVRALAAGALLALAACGGGDEPTTAPAAADPSTPDPAAGIKDPPRRQAIAAPSQGRWSNVINLSLVPAAGALLPTGKVLFWSAESRFTFYGSNAAQTYTTLFDPVTRTAAETVVSSTSHNMFCPGTSQLPDGRLLVNGGIGDAITSLYNPTTNTWTRAADMVIPRGYNANCVLEDGSVFTIGGSWSGAVGGKHGEVWTAAAGWRRLTGVPVTPMLSVDPSVNSNFGGDSHFWLFPAGNGRVLHAGPGMAMHWIDTRGNGAVTAIGPRGDDEFSVNGNAVMYDVNKVLKVGGAAAYEDLNANANAYVIDVNAGAAVRKIAPMVYPRAYHNSVVLPNGQVMVVGGMTFAKNFTDNTAILANELFDPATETFTVLPAMSVPRTYHSLALLLPDARVLSGGGGLCGDGCSANHPDVQIYTPHYLLNADGSDAVRPAITTAPAQATHGTRLNVATDASVAAFSLVRVSAVTHSVNNDQRRVPLAFTVTGANAYEVALPSNPGVVVPGMYMLFAMNADGVPSVAHMIRVSGDGAPRIVNPGDQTTPLNTTVSLPLSATAATGYAATGLPPGLAINATSGGITGVATTAGQYLVTLIATNATAPTSTTLMWTVGSGGNNSLPTLAAIADQNHAQGVQVSLALSASDPDGDPLTFSASGLPPGLSIAASSGAITGAPTLAGTYAVTAQVADGRGGTASRSFTWTITAGGFVLDPVPAPPVTAGNSASFTANTSGASGVTYVWNFGDGSPPTAPTASSTATHVYAAPGLYTVTVTATDGAGTVRTRTFVQAVVGAVAGSARPTQSSNVVFEPASGGGNPRIWLVNQDNDSVSVFDATTRAKLAEVAVGAMPRSIAIAPDGRVWVANKGAASISIINRTSFAVVQTVALPRASMPFGVAFAPDGSAAYVALEATGQLLRLNPTSGATLATLAVGANPRHVSVTAASDRALVSRFVSPPLPGEATLNVDTGSAGGEVVVVTAPAMAIERTVVLRHSDRTDTTLQGSGIPNYLSAAVIAPDGRSAWVASKQDNVKRGSARNGLALDFQNTVRAISSRIDLSAWTEDPAQRVDHDNSSLGSAAAFHPSGAYVFVALQTSREVAVLDPTGRTEIMRFASGRAPDGLAVSADGTRLYVNNFMDRTLGVFDLSRLAGFGELTIAPIATLASVGTEKLSAQILAGKQLFYDARDTRLARDGYMSCASCHNDGGHDGRVWDLSSLGEGLRNTISLRGRGLGHGRQHWTGNFDEVQDFEGQIRTLAGGTGLMSDADFNNATRSQPLGTPKAGVSADLDALAAYVGSLDAFAPSPQRPSVATLSTAAQAGRTAFVQANCASCHSGSTFSNSITGALRDVGTIKPSSGQRLGAPLTGFDVPTLRDVWATAPYLHDGSAPTLEAAVLAHTTLGISASNAASVAAYLREIGSEEGPAQGNGATIWAPTAAPAGPDDVDSQAINLGTKFRSSTAGIVTAIRFYKGPNNTGTHRGALWTAAGQQLASVTFANETATGWQQADLAVPVAIAADTVYVVSYLVPNAFYAGEDNYFATAGVSNPPLYALRDGESGGNGVYVYGAALAFPNQTYLSEGYWVDVVLQPSTTTDTTPPTVTGLSPASGATGVALGSTVTAAFSEPIDPATVSTQTFELRGPGGVLVAGSVAYDAVSRTATFTPTGALAASTTYSATVRGGTTDPRIKDAAGNALAASSTWSFTTAAAADTTPPTITTRTPASGAAGVAVGASVVVAFSEALDAATVNATTVELRDAANAVVSATVSYNAASFTATLQPGTALANAATYTVTVRGGATAPVVRDAAGNALATSSSWSFTTAAASTGCPCSLWPTTTVPAVAAATDTSAVNLGVKFRSDLAGYVTGMRFYKGSANTGTHVGSLWSASGQLLGRATFVNETASGWQQVTFASPVAIAANTTYVASYLAPVGRYAIDNNFFATNATDRAPLHAPNTATAGGNGVYTYGASSVFPTSTFNASNYWVDVVFETSAVDTTPPTVTARTPASGATGVVTGTAVTATFSEAVDPGSIGASTIELKNSSGAAVAATLAYDAAALRATLTPSAALAAGTTYTASVRGGAVDPVVRDVAGNRLAATDSWSFTTASAGDTTPPTVTTTSPTSGATGISRTTNITVTFSEAMSAASITTASIELRAPGGAVVPSVVSYSATNRRATLNPTPTLNALTVYTVVVRGGAADPRVKDAAGNALAADVVWAFTTR